MDAMCGVSLLWGDTTGAGYPPFPCRRCPIPLIWGWIFPLKPVQEGLFRRRITSPKKNPIGMGGAGLKSKGETSGDPREQIHLAARGHRSSGLSIAPTFGRARGLSPPKPGEGAQTHTSSSSSVSQAPLSAGEGLALGWGCRGGPGERCWPRGGSGRCPSGVGIREGRLPGRWSLRGRVLGRSFSL